jgi:hypothetical protein
VQGSHAWCGDGAVFDEDNLVSHAGLVPLLELAEQAGLSRLLDEHVRFVDERVKSGAANSTPKLTSIIAGMAAGADSIDDLDVIRSGGMRKVFGGVYAAATLGIFLREFTHGHTRQLSPAPGRARRANRGAGRHRRPGLHRHRLPATPGVRARQAGRLVRPYEDRGEGHPAPGPVAAGGDHLHPDRGAGAGRGAVAGRPGRLGQGRGEHGHRGDQHRQGRRRTTSSSAATPRTAAARQSPRSSKPERNSLLPSPAIPRSTPRSAAFPTSSTRPCAIPARSPIRTPQR